MDSDTFECPAVLVWDGFQHTHAFSRCPEVFSCQNPRFSPRSLMLLGDWSTPENVGRFSGRDLSPRRIADYQGKGEVGQKQSCGHRKKCRGVLQRYQRVQQGIPRCQNRPTVALFQGVQRRTVETPKGAFPHSVCLPKEAASYLFFFFHVM